MSETAAPYDAGGEAQHRDDSLAEALGRLRLAHREERDWDHDDAGRRITYGFCRECDAYWPCDVAALLNEVERQVGEVARLRDDRALLTGQLRASRRRVEELEDAVIALAGRLAALTAVVEAARAYQRAEMRYQTQQRNGIRSGAVADERHDADVALDQALDALDATAAGRGAVEG